MASAALPLVCFVIPYVINGQLGHLLNGLFILPQRRLEFASMAMPPAGWILAGLPLVAVALPFPGLARTSVIGIRLTGIVACSSWGGGRDCESPPRDDVSGYLALGSRACGPASGCWHVGSLCLVEYRDAKQRWILFGFASMLAWASLVQFPFSAPIYFCYTTPLVIIAAVAVAGNSGTLRRPVFGGATALLLVFAVAVMNRGYIYNLGFEHNAYALNASLDPPKASLQVSAVDAETYRRVRQLIAEHLGTGRLVAGPDCPEVYFLADQFSPSGTLFDFFAGRCTCDRATKHVGVDERHRRRAESPSQLLAAAIVRCPCRSSADISQHGIGRAV